MSLTFDDGFADQLVASRILNDHGMSGTFYIVSGFIGLPGYMTLEDLDGLKADRHEIGGHTVTHPNLATVSAAEANRQICQDRKTLLSWGYPVSSFAYPFSGFNASVEKIARQCGYRTARAVGSLKSPHFCAQCPVTETVPPADLYATRTPKDIDTNWSLADLRDTVTRAEASGGWLTFNFHHLCNSCSPLSIRPTVFEQFIGWLKARSSTSVRTYVRTVQQVITGGVRPAVAPRPSPPPAAPGINALRNPTLETAGSANPAVPHCWSSASFSTSKATYSRTTDAHTGAFASRITMTGSTDGDAKFVPTFDLGDCSPSVAGDHTYEVSAWYKSTTEVYFSLYQRDAIGQWAYWTQSPRLEAAKDWTKATWITPAVPSEAVAASFGLTIDLPGTLTTDDLSFVDYTPTAAPPPTPSRVTAADSAADPANQSGTRDWLGIIAITIALMGLIAGLLDNYRRRTR